MREQRGLDHVAAMGVTEGMARKPLAHATPSHWLPEASGAPDHAEVEQVAEQHHIPPVVASELLQLDRRSAAKPAERPSSTEAAKPAADSTDNTDTVDMTPPRFELWFARASAKGVWVADQQQDLQQLRQFMQRVTTAMGAEPDLAAQPVQFRWPFIESQQHDQSLPVARQALMAQWQFIRQQGVDYVITVGADSQQWLHHIDVTTHHHIADLQQCLQSADEQRALWQALKQLSPL